MDRHQPSRRHRRFGVALLVSGMLLALAAGRAPGASAGPPSPSTAQTTAVIVSATNAPLRVLGDDGMEHLEYDLIITNVFTAPVTLIAIEVTAPDGAVLLRLEGDALTANTQPVFAGPPTNQVPVAGVVATIMDVVVPPGQAPAQIGHRITYDLPADAPDRTAIGSFAVDGPDLPVNPREPLVIAPPLRGDGWLTGNGCCSAASVHRYFRLAVDGSHYVKPEIFAIDWVQIKDGGLFVGDGSRVEQYFGFGAEVHSVAEGTVVAVRNDMPEETPGQPPVAVHAPQDYTGNHVVVQIRPDVWAVYAHMQPGSISVRVGDRVATGQLLGRLGNTGNSTAPHLHFGLQDGPDPLASNSVPFVLDRYTLAGTIDPEALDAATDGPSGPPIQIEGPAQAQSGTFPLFMSVADFP